MREPGFVGVSAADPMLMAVLLAPFSRCADRHQARYSEQVAGTGRKKGLRLGLGDSIDAALSHPADGLEPPEDFLDALAGALTGSVARMACRASIKARRVASRDPRDVRPDVMLAQMLLSNPVSAGGVNQSFLRPLCLASYPFHGEFP